MNVSSSSSPTPASTQVEVMKKALQTQEQQVLKILEGAAEQSQKVAAQKTGIGNNLNIAG
jgi:hypothetical protein